ncbi:hypothetical protein AYO28_18840 [Pseudomonas putida]|uniref:Uncharacterized protein n=1 Tax=Pseudomonas putida TaxID=303 RepID=A0A177SN55_PSEPU|nr:hypothetical protein AYO28_18840 [Pseudomonas putida]
MTLFFRGNLKFDEASRTAGLSATHHRRLAQRTSVSAANAQLLALHAQLIQLMSQSSGVSLGRVDTTA